jgi:hypothetical protein
MITTARPAQEFPMGLSPKAQGTVFILAVLSSLLLSSAAMAQVAGQNVNMVSGTGWTNGDPFLERQNEPSIAVSTRNTSHLFGAANDYRTVDLPGLLGIDERGDAWLGIYKSFDNGLTWQSTLLPGYPLDSSPEGTRSPIHGRQAAADPLVRAGSNGLFYLTGIAFDRGTGATSNVFISRFIDLNNKENGDATSENQGVLTNLAPRDTVKYIDTTVIDTGSPTRFLDKPWAAMDIPRGKATCTIAANEDGTTVTQKIPAGAIYTTYTAFTTVGKVQNSQLLFRRSMDCGATWSNPIVLSQSDDAAGQPDAEGQGTVIAIDPSVPAPLPATIYVAWRVFAVAGDPDDAGQIRIARSLNGGLSFDEQEPVVKFPLSCNKTPTGAGCPFDQGTTSTSFRSNGYPALTVDNYGRIYVAWSQRDSNGDGRIMMTVSRFVESWPSSNFKEIDFGSVPDDYGSPFTNLSNRGSQLMPTLNFTAGKLILTYYDLRQDHTSGSLSPAPEPACDPAVTVPCPLGNPFSEMRQFEAELFTNPVAVFNAYVDDRTLTVRRHTLDIIGSEAVPQPGFLNFSVPTFTHFRVSRYEYGIIPPDANVEQAQFNAPNLPMFMQGTASFIGDYIDLAGAPSMVPNGSNGWKFNTSPSATPVFHAVWTDNRDVLPPPDGISWNKYTPPFSASIGTTSKFDPTQTPPACVPGYSGMRNQNIYTSTISNGLTLTSPQTAKPVLQPNGQPIQREFALILHNDTNQARGFQLRIPAQPASAQVSFLQFSLQTALTVNIPALSSASRPVFVTPKTGSTVTFPAFEVDATETDGAQPPLTASILFNADPTNPALANPDNAAFGGTTIPSQEFYNPAILNPAILNPAILNPAILNPAILNPAILNPAILNPAILNPAILNPNFVVALNPAILNPAILNPAILNNAVANPAILNPAILNSPVSDANYTVTNQGNTSATYQVQLFQSGSFPANSVLQLILSKTYLTPGVDPRDGCTYGGQVNNEVITSIAHPTFVTDPTQLGNPAILNSAINNPTFSLAPGDTAQITLRANLTVSDLANFVLPNLTPVVASHAVNTVDVQQGSTTPPISLIITTSSLHFGVTGQTYSSTLASLGGNPPSASDTWSLFGGSLPPNLTLSPGGVISGIPTVPGTFPFVVQVMDTGTPQHIARHTLSISVYSPVAIQTAPLPNAATGSQYTQLFSATGGLPAYTWSSTGNLPPGLVLLSNGTLSGIPTSAGTYSFTVRATDSLGLFGSTPYSILVTNAVPLGAQLLFIVQPGNTVSPQVISPPVLVQVFDANLDPIPNAQVSIAFGSHPCAAATLSGTLSVVSDASGLASFSNLSINRGGQGYTFTAAATFDPLVSANSDLFGSEGFCETGSLTVARRNHLAITLPNGKVLIAGGAANSNGSGALTSAEIYDPVTHASTTIGGMSAARVDFTGTLLPNGKVLITGGFNDTTNLATAELFDPATNLFTLLDTHMTVARAEHAATLLPNGTVLITGGNSSATTTEASAELFDPSTNSLLSTDGGMSTTRQIHHADLLPNGTVLITGGFDVNGNALASAELFDPSIDGFTSVGIGSMGTARGNHATALLGNGKVLVAGGLTPTGITASAELFDPSTGAFSPTGSMTQPRERYFSIVLGNGMVLIEDGGPLAGGGNADLYDPAAGAFIAAGNMTATQIAERETLLPDGTVLLTGGYSASTTVATDEIFYPINPPFLVQGIGPTGNLNVARGYGRLVTLPNGKALYAGGAANSDATGALASAETYDPATHGFTLVGSMNAPRIDYTATMLRNGRVLISGGLSDTAILSSAELFDPGTNTFTLLNTNMTSPRQGHTATLLPNGTVLIAGGNSVNMATVTTVASAEIFDPTTNSFSSSQLGMTTARFGHHADLLPNGQVLVTGGFDTNGNPLASAELYNPSSLTFTPTGSMATARGFHSSALLYTGKVLVAGGNGPNGATATAELYDTSTGTFGPTGNMVQPHGFFSAVLGNGLVFIASGGVPAASGDLYNPATGTFSSAGTFANVQAGNRETLLPDGTVLVSGGFNASSTVTTSELYQFGALQQLPALSCGLEGHIQSVNSNTPTAIRFVNTSTTATFQVFWLNFTGQRVLYTALAPGQSYVQSTFLTHPWVIADTSDVPVCQEIYLPVQEQAPAVFPPPLL